MWTTPPPRSTIDGALLGYGHPLDEFLNTPLTPFPWASTVTNGSAKAKSQLSGWRDPLPWTDPSLTGPGSELFTCLSVPPSGGGWQRGGAIPVPEGMGSNGPITAKPDRGDWPWRCPLAVWSSQLKPLCMICEGAFRLPARTAERGLRVFRWAA